jgi:hypothetical protein
MGRRTKLVAQLDEVNGIGSLRDYWLARIRKQLEAKARQRRYVKAHDKKRPKCRCQAYPWPHRPTGGLCRYPDPPVERYQPKPRVRPYRKRYTGILKQIARNNGLNPIRDRALIQALMPDVLDLARELHAQYPRFRYRNMKITENGITGY